MVHLADGVLLLAIKRLNGERSERSLFHVLNGKRSATTLQDAFFYELEPVFGQFPQTTYSYESLLKGFEKRGWLDRKQFKLTEAGNLLSSPETVKDLFNRLGGERRDYNATTWKRLSLFVQTFMSREHERAFYPVQADRPAEQWVKQLLQIDRDWKILMQTFHHEIEAALDTIGDPYATAVVYRFTGAFETGLTYEQIASLLDVDAETARLYFLAGWNELLTVLPKEAKLRGFTYGLSTERMTFSARESYDLFLKGYSFQQVQSRRRLRTSTIEDHVVEMAMYLDTFPLDQFVPSDDIVTIEKLRDPESWALKPIFEKMGNVSYFQIRLVFARLKRGETFV
ncbi:helix-turn-helix domain-containing protein [Exiguobacterium sp. B2(2022)]|uniref:helix-turn-helix domain-containing protein n=1 Tax=Exiguobacterium sp. B2(2022) TaxID=2992755 RepID=UPI00237BB5CB|nr:helix-turn-helix domain-containing protein [Exiguobacterium sp. B2(2022)]MDE0562129.1 helix-turn-helix domain-containing protein [Exiguobacterium sp. B2(2022)]